MAIDGVIVDDENPRIEKCDGILDNLVGSLDLPKVEKSPKGKVMMQAMYGVKVQIVFVYSVFAAAFLGSTKKLIDLDVAEIYTWVPEFKSLQNLVNEEVRVRFSSGRFPVLKELEAVDSVIKELYPIILNVVEPIETELDLKTVEQLGRATEKLSKGLDLLAKGVNGFFQVVLSGRDALLSNLRSGGIVYGRGSGGNIVASWLYPSATTFYLLTSQLIELLNGMFNGRLEEALAAWLLLLRSVKTELLLRYES
ncbi:Protein BPS1 [Arachis hypogaea]|nr:Protein BPS1 [Arachis hypogaea]